MNDSSNSYLDSSGVLPPGSLYARGADRRPAGGWLRLWRQSGLVQQRPIKPFVGNARFHVLNFLGPWWCASPLRFPTELVVGYTKYIMQHGGVVTWDVPISPTGLIPEPFMEQLRAIGIKR